MLAEAAQSSRRPCQRVGRFGTVLPFARSAQQPAHLAGHLTSGVSVTLQSSKSLLYEELNHEHCG
jgi:hypothetical protein